LAVSFPETFAVPKTFTVPGVSDSRAGIGTPARLPRHRVMTRPGG
jgi:hypothetical protein